MARVPAAAPEAPEPRVECVPVFESYDGFAIGFAKGPLEDAGIPFWMQNNRTAARLALGRILLPSSRFLVLKDREAEAREVLEPLHLPRSPGEQVERRIHIPGARQARPRPRERQSQ